MAKKKTKLMAVAGAYDAPQARRLGIKKASQLLAYAEATPAADVARVLADANPRIGDQRLGDMSARELKDATRRVRVTGRASEVPAAERDARRIAREVQKRLRAKGAKSAKARAEPAAGEWTILVRVAAGEADAIA